MKKDVRDEVKYWMEEMLKLRNMVKEMEKIIREKEKNKGRRK